MGNNASTLAHKDLEEVVEAETGVEAKVEASNEPNNVPSKKSKNQSSNASKSESINEESKNDPPTLVDDIELRMELAPGDEGMIVQEMPIIQKFRVASGWIEALDLDERLKVIIARKKKEKNLPRDDGVDHSRFASDLIVILDLDDCLVHSILPRSKAKFPVRDKYGKPVYGPAFLLRPGLIEFLRATMTRYETHVFTASASDHADPILDALLFIGDLPSFAGRWYRQHCTRPCGDAHYTKDIASLPLGVRAGDLRKMVLVDNNALSFRANPTNGIPIRDFHDDVTDQSLLALFKLLLKLESVEDVRTVLDKRFGVQALLGYFHNSPKFTGDVLALFIAMEEYQL